MSSNDSSVSRARKTRFVLISDTHNTDPRNGAFKIPLGDVLIHAGDLTNNGTYGELAKTIEWIAEAPCEVKIVIAGNHDIGLDEQLSLDYQKCLELFEKNETIIYLNHTTTTITLPSAPGVSFKIFGSPKTPVWKGHGKRFRGFVYEPEEAQAMWSDIEDGTDVVVTHGPAFGALDLTYVKERSDDEQGSGQRIANTDDEDEKEVAKKKKRIGCEGLRKVLEVVKPRLAVCGHVHGSRGVIRTTFSSPYSAKALTTQSSVWNDPGANNKKQSLCDVSSHTSMFGCQPLHVGEETLCVNASIMTHGWPHGGVRNKAIVVNLDLPVVDMV